MFIMKGLRVRFLNYIFFLLITRDNSNIENKVEQFNNPFSSFMTQFGKFSKHDKEIVSSSLRKKKRCETKK